MLLIIILIILQYYKCQLIFITLYSKCHCRTVALQLHAGLGFFKPIFCLLPIKLIIHSKNRSQLIEIFDQVLVFGKMPLIAFNQQTTLSNCSFLMARLVKFFVKSCNYSSLHAIMHLWFKKAQAISLLHLPQSRPENLFIMVAPILLSMQFCHVFCKSKIFSTFWQV